MNEHQENMTTNVIIENVIRQMSGATNTHNVYNSYAHTPQQQTAASADASMDARLDREGQDMEDALRAHSERTKVKARQNAQTVRENLKASTQQTQAEEAAGAHAQNNYRPPDPPPPPVGQPIIIPMQETENTIYINRLKVNGTGKLKQNTKKQLDTQN